MNNFEKQEQPKYYEIIPEFNSDGRLCNHGSGTNQKVKVMADEWERFNKLAGRQHEIIKGVVVYNEDLEPCMPDADIYIDPITALELAVTEIYEVVLSNG